MKRCNKLRSARGETLTETLMAVLILSLIGALANPRASWCTAG